MNVRRFLRDARAAATALAAAAVTVMTMGGAALVSDHVWLVDQRDALKSATDAATIAATEEMTEQVNRNPGIDDASLEAALLTVAERYILLNLGYLPPERFQRVEDSLQIAIAFDRILNTVDVAAAAEIGETLFAGTLPMFGESNEPQMVRVEAAVENVPNPVEVALALDISGSMHSCLDGRSCKTRNKENSRLSIVKRAGEKLVDILDPRADKQVAIAVVPWHTEVRLDPDARAKWELESWAKYPLSRHYGAIFQCSGRETDCTPPDATQALPALAPEPWEGCLDEHRVETIGRVAKLPALANLFDPPSARAFAQGFYISSYMFAYECLSGPLPGDFGYQLCFDTRHHPGKQSVKTPQYRCRADVPSVLPLTSARPKIEQAISALEAVGDRTYSALGVLWAQRMLSHSWKSAWGDAVHPVDPTVDENTRKAIVLLTDGQDTHCGIGNTSCDGSAVGISRADACAAAKAAGSEVFVIAAMDPGLVSSSFEDDLRECSSEPSDSPGTHIFVNIATPDALVAAFADIAKQLLVVRRTR